MLEDLRLKIESQNDRLLDWTKLASQRITPPFYLSCDIRHSGFKMGIVDTNLFPQGFNNLCAAFGRQASQAFKNYLQQNHPGSKNILIYAENHTRNRFYLENLWSLKKLLTDAGYAILIAMESAVLESKSSTVHLSEGRQLTIECLDEVIAKPSLKSLDLIISNNDFSGGLPQALKNLTLPIIPSPELGWHRRRKSQHFSILKKLTCELAQKLDFDPWHVLPDFVVEKNIDIQNDHDMARLSASVDKLIQKIAQEYEKRHIDETPYVFIKNDAGTYGMGITTVFSGAEVLTLNRKRRQKLSATKERHEVNDYLIQEGIPTADFYSQFPIEPVIYAVGWQNIGGFFRIHEKSDHLQSLNTPGMTFSCLCLHKLDEPHEAPFIKCTEKTELVWLSNFLVRLAAIAAGMENTNKNPEHVAKPL